MHCALLGKSLDAIGAELHAFTVDTRPLKIHIALGLYGRIIMASQKFTSSGHNRFFAASRTTSHIY